MTLPYERTRSVVSTREFLLDLTNPEVTPRLPRYIRDTARSLLRHYPTNYDMETVSEREDRLHETTNYRIFGKDETLL
jgi:hypothetical protein